MKFRKENNIYIVRLEKGEEIIGTLTKFCEENKIKSGFISGLGGAGAVTLKYFNIKQNKYLEKKFDEGVNYEILALNGNVSVVDNKPFVHIHIMLGDPDYSVFGGHLGSAIISITAEICITVADAPISRKIDKDFNLNFLEL